MPNAARPALDPQTENEIIDAIIALDWNTDVHEHGVVAHADGSALDWLTA
jgi:hypothetical protein